MPIEWSFIISSESTLEKTILSIDKYDLDADLLPFYNGENIAFFKKNVYTNIEDLNTNIVNKQQIFSRQVINENMFGKLTLLPNGDLYANVNKACLGNVLHKSLNEIIYKEKNMKDAWFMTRSQTPCKQCVYCLLCPSVSNYELVLGKFDLCSIREGYLEK